MRQLDNKRVDFVQKCGELLNIAKPNLVSCQLLLGKDLPESKFERYIPDDEYVLVMCENGCSYKLPVEGNSLASIADTIFSRMVHK